MALYRVTRRGQLWKRLNSAALAPYTSLRDRVTRHEHEVGEDDPGSIRLTMSDGAGRYYYVLTLTTGQADELANALEQRVRAARAATPPLA